MLVDKSENFQNIKLKEKDNQLTDNFSVPFQVNTCFGLVDTPIIVYLWSVMYNNPEEYNYQTKERDKQVAKERSTLYYCYCLDFMETHMLSADCQGLEAVHLQRGLFGAG